jgi:hypothetical protein
MVSKAVRDMVTRGRILLAVERYKKEEASLGRAAELAAPLPLPLVPQDKEWRTSSLGRTGWPSRIR